MRIERAIRRRQHVGQMRGILTNLRATAQIESNYDETTDSFDAMDLKPELLRGVYAYGFERPSAIQQRAIMPVIKGALSSLRQNYKRSKTYIPQATMSSLRPSPVPARLLLSPSLSSRRSTPTSRPARLSSSPPPASLLSRSRRSLSPLVTSCRSSATPALAAPAFATT